jgi:hypothetical protein
MREDRKFNAEARRTQRPEEQEVNNFRNKDLEINELHYSLFILDILGNSGLPAISFSSGLCVSASLR